MDKEKQCKINNCNRKRGAAFEKRVADYLGFEVVPYSGSNTRYGMGDVRNDTWMGECKNIKPDEKGRVCIKKSWLDKAWERAKNENKRSFLIFTPSGKPEKYVIIDTETYYKILNCDDTTIADIQDNTNHYIDLSTYKSMINHGMYFTKIENGYYITTLEIFDTRIIELNIKGKLASR